MSPVRCKDTQEGLTAALVKDTVLQRMFSRNLKKNATAESQKDPVNCNAAEKLRSKPGEVIREKFCYKGHDSIDMDHLVDTITGSANNAIVDDRNISAVESLVADKRRKNKKDENVPTSGKLHLQPSFASAHKPVVALNVGSSVKPSGSNRELLQLQKTHAIDLTPAHAKRQSARKSGLGTVTVEPLTLNQKNDMRSLRSLTVIRKKTSGETLAKRVKACAVVVDRMDKHQLAKHTSALSQYDSNIDDSKSEDEVVTPLIIRLTRKTGKRAALECADVTASDDDFNFAVSAPAAKRARRSCPGSKSKDASNVARKKMQKPIQMPKKEPKKSATIFTPLLKHPTSSSYAEARACLQGAIEQEWLPCRDTESRQIHQFLATQVRHGTSSCMYVSGVPGTGKTASVNLVVAHMREDDSLDDFTFIPINGMQLSDPNQVFQVIYRHLTGLTVRISSVNAARKLDEHFSGTKRLISKPQHVILLLDEMDQLWTKNQRVLYQLFDWPSRTVAPGLSVLSIANTLDLPERFFIHRVSSRLGMQRICFQPYTFQQLEEILQCRLVSVLSGMDQDAIQLLARKVAAVSGDVRRALELCRRGLELAEAESKNSGSAHQQVTLKIEHVSAAMKEAQASPMVLAVRAGSLHEKLIFRAILSELQRTGLPYVEYVKLTRAYRTLANVEAQFTIGADALHMLVSKFCDRKLLLAPPGLFRNLHVNISLHDLTFALRDE